MQLTMNLVRSLSPLACNLFAAIVTDYVTDPKDPVPASDYEACPGWDELVKRGAIHVTEDGYIRFPEHIPFYGDERVLAARRKIQRK